MADTLKRLYGPAVLTTSVVTLYTVPALTSTVLRYIRFVNTTATDRTVTMSIGADAAATRIFAAMTVPANGSMDWTGTIPLVAAEIIQASASAATAINVIISGIEVT